jgi:hypothetical protein
MNMPQKATEMFWAFVYAITMATILSVIGYVLPRPENTTQAIFRIADALVTGALGFFAGRASVFASQIKDQPPPPGDESK